MGNIGTTKNDYEYWFNKPSSFVRATTGETSIKSTDGILAGIFVGSGTVATLKFWDSATTGTGTVLLNTFVPILGNIVFPNIKFSNGLYLTSTGPFDITISYK
jgi:hypothetical protein